MPSNIEQEITQLEQQLAEKRVALGKEQPAPETEPLEKEMLHGVVGERIQQQVPQYRPAPQPPKDEDKTPSYSEPELTAKVQDLINVVFNKGLNEGIKEVSKTNNPALIDAFHDVLVDELYNVLLERKKLEPVQ